MQLKVGDRVRFELNKVITTPRWNHDEDRGGSGKWETGVVESFTTDCRVWIRRDNGRGWFWPIEGNERYSSDQWNRPGYLQLVGSSQAPSVKKCVCGAEKVYGAGCNTHSSWCDLA